MIHYTEITPETRTAFIYTLNHLEDHNRWNIDSSVMSSSLKKIVIFRFLDTTLSYWDSIQTLRNTYKSDFIYKTISEYILEQGEINVFPNKTY